MVKVVRTMRGLKASVNRVALLLAWRLERRDWVIRSAEALRDLQAASERDLLRLSIAYIQEEPRKALELLERLSSQGSTATDSGFQLYHHALVLSKLGQLEHSQELLTDGLCDAAWWESDTRRSASQLLAHVLVSRARAFGEGYGVDWGFLSTQIDALRRNGIDNDWLRYLNASASMEFGAWRDASRDFDAIEGTLDDDAEPSRWTDHARALFNLGYPRAAWDLLNGQISGSWPREAEQEGRSLLDDIAEELEKHPEAQAGRNESKNSVASGAPVVGSPFWPRMKEALRRSNQSDLTWLAIYSLGAPCFTAWLVDESLPLFGTSEGTFEPLWFFAAAAFTVAGWYYWSRLFMIVFAVR